MPLLSCFTPTGFLTLSSEPSHAEKIYNSLAAQYAQSGISIEPGSREDCTIYAQAMGIARAKYALQKAGNQMLAAKVSDLIDEREAEYGLVPGPTATMPERRAAIAAAKRLPGGATQNNVENALRELVGSSFRSYRVAQHSEVTNYPTDAADSPNAFKLPTVPSKLVTLDTDVCVDLGAPQAVAYTRVSLPSHPNASNAEFYIRRGDVLVVDAGQPGLEERVQVTAVTATTLTASFAMAHGAGALCTTQPWPRWTSAQRTALIVLSGAAAVDADVRRAINDLMERLARGVSTWAIVEESVAGQTGPFLVEDSPLGATTVSAVSIP